jgi:hypothetical protein
MLDVEPLILEELHRLSPLDLTEHGDWNALLANARAVPVRAKKKWTFYGAGFAGLRRRPRRTVAVALALVLITLLATPAFGVQGYVLHLLGRKNVSFVNSPSAPNEVKKQFEDLSIGAPRQFSPQVKAAQARVVATFSIAGHPRKLWVAPTRDGGYCYTFERSFGGCRQTRAARSIGSKGQFAVSWTAVPPTAVRGSSPALSSVVSRVAGDLTAPAAAKITARYADGTSYDIPFVWVSKPIAAGFFSYDVPVSRWNKQHRLLAVSLYGNKGRLIARQTFPYRQWRPAVGRPLPPTHITGPKQRQLPTTPPVAPSQPQQRGNADGFSVVVGHNGSVQFTQIGQTPILRELVGHSAGYGCFRLTKEFGIFTVRGLSDGGKFAPKVGFDLSGVGFPVDGCEVQASIGHVWPDRLHNRAAVEIPLTLAGRRFFANRAAARDLALFVRSRRMHQLRKEPAAQAKRDIEASYARDLAQSPIRITVINASTLRFSESSPTGRRFQVTVTKGRISSENVKPLAFVF